MFSMKIVWLKVCALHSKDWDKGTQYLLFNVLNNEVPIVGLIKGQENW